jgi:hypothetical protein
MYFFSKIHKSLNKEFPSLASDCNHHSVTTYIYKVLWRLLSFRAVSVTLPVATYGLNVGLSSPPLRLFHNTTSLHPLIYILYFQHWNNSSHNRLHCLFCTIEHVHYWPTTRQLLTMSYSTRLWRRSHSGNFFHVSGLLRPPSRPGRLAKNLESAARVEVGKGQEKWACPYSPFPSSGHAALLPLRDCSS